MPITEEELSRCVRRVVPELAERPLQLSEHLIDDWAMDSLARLQLAIELQGQHSIVLPEAVIQSGCRAGEILFGPPFTPARKVAKVPGIQTPPEHLPLSAAIPAMFRSSLFIFVSLLAVLVLLLPLKPLRRRALTRRLGGLFLTVAGIRVTTEGALPATKGLVIVVNHQSYIDAVLLHIVLPSTTVLVAKGEFRTSHLMSWIFGLLGMPLLERWNVRQSQEDLEAMAALLSENSVLFFPEGTFDGRSDLLPFKTGAFVLAARHHVPVLPMFLAGTRKLLPPGSWLLRSAEVSLTILDPIHREGEPWSTALAMRDEAQRLFTDTLRVD